MAGQNIERRDALRFLAAGAAASGFPGFVRWAFAFSPPQMSQVKPARYSPLFFTPAEYRMLDALTELIIPSDGTPGAQQAGVAEFIDFMVSEDRSLQFRFRYGLAWIGARSKALHDLDFERLTPDQQTGLLEPLAYASRFQPGQEDGRTFFRLLREYTVMGFYTTRIGLEQLDYPGLRMYSKSPECPHHDDPEHRRLGERNA
jgi:hypothetical protein